MIKAVLVIVLIVAAVVAALRLRKLHRDDARVRIANRETHPTSPYVASKGFRLVDDDDDPVVPAVRRPDPSRPRLEPGRDYVFSDGQTPVSDEGTIPTGRRDSKWALERSAHRPRFSISSRRFITFALILIAALVIAGLFLNHHHAPHQPVGIGLVDGARHSFDPVVTGARPQAESPSPWTAHSSWLWSVALPPRSLAL